MEQEAFIDSQETSTREDEPVVGDIRKDWDSVRPCVEWILQNQPQLSFRAEDVYAEVVSGSAVYWKSVDGFVVTTIEVDGFTSEKTLLVWLAWSHKRGNKTVLKHFPFFQRVAAEHGMEALEVRTPHQGMEQVLLDAGWQLDTVVYRLEV
nr:hypothetical protein [Halomonas sp.]